MRMKKTRFLLMTVFVAVLSVSLLLETSHSARKKRPPHHEYGNVVLNKLSEKSAMRPVVFNHWLHRSKYSCRLCHEDLKFAMKANGTGITEEASRNGQYCGACHNGKEAFGHVQKTPAGGKSGKTCDRC